MKNVTDFMRMSILLSLCFLLMCGIVKAQEKQFDFGVKFGMNLSSQPGKSTITDSQNNPVLRMQGGVYLKVGVTKRIGIQPEILFSGQGDHSTSTTYINFPFHLYYHVLRAFDIQAGIQKGLLVNAKSNLGGNNLFSNYYSGDFGYSFGVSYEIHERINFTLRYIRGTSNIIYTDNSASQIKPYANNNVIQVSIGYRILPLVLTRAMQH